MVWEVSRKELTRSQLVSWTCWSCFLSAIVVLLSYSQESASFHDSHVSSLTTDGACRKRSKARPAGHAAIVLARCVYGLYDMHKNVVQAECTIRALRCKLGKDTKPYRRELVILHNFWVEQGHQTLQPFEKLGRAGREKISERVHGEMTVLLLIAESPSTSETHRLPVA